MDSKGLVIMLLTERNRKKEMCALTPVEESEIRDRIVSACLSDEDWEVVERIIYGRKE